MCEDPLHAVTPFSESVNASDPRVGGVQKQRFLRRVAHLAAYVPRECEQHNAVRIAKRRAKHPAAGSTKLNQEQNFPDIAQK